MLSTVDECISTRVNMEIKALEMTKALAFLKSIELTSSDGVSSVDELLDTDTDVED